MENGEFEITGFAGSLREGSYNRALLEAFIERAPDSGIKIQKFDLRGLPLYNGDVEDRGDPEPVTALKDQVESSDGLLIVTPEYNHGMPAVTKNAVDWASRNPKRDRSVLHDKPVAVAGATPGTWGTLRSQLQLKQSLSGAAALPLPRPSVLVAGAGEKFEDGELRDEETREVIDNFLESFVEWIAKVG